MLDHSSFALHVARIMVGACHHPIFCLQVRLHYTEVVGLQSRISSLTNVPVCNFEAMKVG
jgi:hypothetical protein